MSVGLRDAWRRRVLRPWRLACLAWLGLLVVGTHWPRLLKGGDYHVSPDKLLHLFAFAGLAVLLWRSEWLRRAWLLAPLMVALVLLDELTQAWLPLDRTFSWADMIAGGLGAIVGLAAVDALQPRAGEDAALAPLQHSMDRVTLRPGAWAGMIGSGLGALLLVGGLAWLGKFWITGSLSTNGPLLGGIVAGSLAGGRSLGLLLAREHRRMAETHPCFACGATCAGERLNDRGEGACSGCGAGLRASWWRHDPLSRGAWARLGSKALGRASLLGVPVAVLMGWGGTTLLDRLGPTGGPWRILARQLELTLVVAAVGSILVLGVHVARRDLARRAAANVAPGAAD